MLCNARSIAVVFVVGFGSFGVSVLFYFVSLLFVGPPPTSQTNTWRIILNYECPAFLT